MKGKGPGRAPTEVAWGSPRPTPTTHLKEVETPSDGQSIYDDEGIDLVALMVAVVLAAAIAFLLSHLVPQLVDLMTIPPPLSGDALGPSPAK